MAELLLGCGNNRQKRLQNAWRPSEWEHLITLDMDPNCKPDILADIEDGLPFPDDTFMEVHAYEVMEHLRFQGDWKGFFKDFTEIWRVLKHGGIFCGSTPIPEGPTAWSDPGHRRIIDPANFQFLDQLYYAEKMGISTATDYRHVWKGDFRLVYLSRDDELYSYWWTLQAIKQPTPAFTKYVATDTDSIPKTPHSSGKQLPQRETRT